METEDLTMEEKCESVLNIVVESRKRFGKMSIEYDQKTSLMENKLLNLQLETIASFRFKPKHPPNIDTNEVFDNLDNFALEVLERQKRIEDLLKKLKDTQEVVLQIKRDSVAQKMQQPSSAVALLTRAKLKLDME